MAQKDKVKGDAKMSVLFGIVIMFSILIIGLVLCVWAQAWKEVKLCEKEKRCALGLPEREVDKSEKTRLL